MMHVLPVNDWIEHTEDTTCLCEPKLENLNGEMLVIHNALDGREETEAMNEAQREMPKYQCHKVVHALQLSAMEVLEDGGAQLVPADSDLYAPFVVGAEWVAKHREGDPGYYVVYEGGYTSWSPTEAFEKGYTLID